MPVPHIFLALLVTLIWGVNFVVIKVGLAITVLPKGALGRAFSGSSRLTPGP